MLNRRRLLELGATGALLVRARPARAGSDDWRKDYPELVFAAIPSENSADLKEELGPFLTYLGRALGVKVSLRIVSDYAAVIEGQRAGNIHIAFYGPAAFARARMTGVRTDAFLTSVFGDGSRGFYSVLYVLASSPYKTIWDLKGKALGLVDSNSTSGNTVPRFMLDKLGIDPESYFSKVQYTGSHENALIALTQGTVDVAANYWNWAEDSNLLRMLAKGMLKHADGSPMKLEDFREIMRSDLLVNAPMAYLTDLPEPAKAAIRRAFLDAPKIDPAAYAKLPQGRDRAWLPVDNSAYDGMIELVKFVDALRKKRR